MNLAALRDSLARSRPPAGLAAPLAALWHDARGDWDRAHKLAMSARSRDAAWVHAYLHRKEGDLENARYWYGRARRPEGAGSLAAEWKAIATELLAGTSPAR